MAADLVFEWGLTGSDDLVFGEGSPPAKPLTIAAALPGPALSITAVKVAPATLAAALPGPTPAMAAQYRSDTARPLVGRVDPRWQVARPSETGADAGHHQAQPAPASVTPTHQQAQGLQTSTATRHEQAQGLRNHARTGYAEAQPVRPPPRCVPWQTAGMGARRTLRTHWQEATARRHARSTSWQERLRDRRPARVLHWSEAQPLRRSQTGSADQGKPLHAGVHGSRWQEAMRPPAGIWIRPPVPVVPPGSPWSTDLVFRALAEASSVHLVFGEVPAPPATHVVPIREVYLVLNAVSLQRVSDAQPIKVLGMSLSIDVQSWTWGFTATLPATELAYVTPDGDGPIELEASVNGNAYRVLAESLTRERSFGGATLSVQGRGRSAWLAAPYSPVRSFVAADTLTAQQLMAEVLTDNGVPLGWTIDWQIDDWSVPAGVFAMNGSYIDGLLAIAGAAGAYLQPHPSADTLHVLPRYPLPPWEWATAVPDFELPAAAVVTEGIVWTERPAYDRVYVSGTSAGVLGRVTRTGSAGDLVAPMVADPLITAAAAARQRGIAILGDTGRKATVTLRLPVLPETGVIVPGAFVRYVDGPVTRRGLVRGTQVEAALPEVWQRIALETTA